MVGQLRRRASMAESQGGGGHNLPVGYQELEYVKSNGLAGFMVEYEPYYQANDIQQVFGFRVKAIFESTPQSDCIFVGHFYSNMIEAAWRLNVNNVGNATYNYITKTQGSQWYRIATPLVGTTLKEFYMIQKNGKNGEGTAVSMDYVPYSTLSPLLTRIGIGCPTTNSTTQELNPVSFGTNVRLGYVALYKGTNMVYELIPAKRLSDDKIGMYDLVNNMFHSSETSTEFVAGPALNYNLMVVGPNTIEGDVRAGNYFLLDLDTMKQVVGTSAEVTDDYKEYLGAINWSITSGSTYVSLPVSSGTSGDVTILRGASTSSFTVTATVDGNTASKTGTATYDITDYEISSFADLQALESAVNNGTESSFTLPLASGSTYTPVAGFSGAHFRLTNDIDCGNSHVEIGKWNTSLSVNRPFKGIFDGAGYSINNVGGICGVNGSASQGGYVGSALFGYGNGCRVKNFKINGNVTWTGTRGYATIMAIYKGECYFERIYNNVTASAVNIASGNSLFVGWSTSSSGDYFAITHSVVAGSQHSGGGSIIGCGQAYNYNTSYGVYATAILGEYTVGGLSTASTKNISLFQSSATKASSKCCYAIAKVSTEFTSTSALYIAGAVSDQNYEACNIASNFATERISDGTISNTYTQNGIFGGISVTESELRNTQTVTDSLYIHTEGYYPIIDNQFAVMPLVLSRAKYGYTE